MTTELLNCPFCGNVPKVCTVGNFYNVSCQSHPCINPMTGSWGSLELATLAWNTRTESTDLRAAIEDAAKALEEAMRYACPPGWDDNGAFASAMKEGRAALAKLAPFRKQQE